MNRNDSCSKGRAPRRTEGRASYLSGPLCLLIASCASPRMPPPEAAAAAYVQAIEQRDVPALWSMLTKRAKSELTQKELAKLLRDNAVELENFTRTLSAEKPRALGRAELYSEGRKTAQLSLSRGSFWIECKGVLPVAASTPEEAARALRDAVRARDYERVLGLMTPRGRDKVDSAFEALDESLLDLESAVVDVRQDQAVIELLGGRRILLKKEGTEWLVEELE